MKKLLFLLLIILLGVGVGFLTEKRTPSITVEKPAINTPVVLPTQQAGINVLPTPIVSSVNPFSLPTTVDGYVVSGVFATPSSIASHFGFQIEPKTIIGSLGTSYVWNIQNQSLIVEGDPLVVAFSQKVLTNVPLNKSTEEYEAIAKRALLSIPGQSKEISYRLTKTLFAPGDTGGQGTNKTPPTAVLFYYQYYLANLPIFFGSPSLSLASVAITASGDILSLQTHFFPSISQTGNKIGLLPYETLVQNIQTNAIFTRYVDETDPSQNYKATDISPQSVFVTSAVLGYYLVPNEKNPIPVVVFTGIGRSVTGKQIVTTFFSRASK